jgi:predicted NBD/HSP70 family sugar kinase
LDAAGGSRVRHDHNEVNLGRAVREIRRRGVAHSGHIEAITGLGSNRTNKLINALRDGGLVSVGQSRDYEKRVPLTLCGSAGRVIGVDMTLDRITVGVGDLEYRLINEPSKTVRQVPVDDWRTTLDTITATIANELTSVGSDYIVGVGLGLPGPVQRGRGSPESDHLLTSWEGVPVAKELSERITRAGITDCPVVVGNDASLGALGVVTRAVWGNPSDAPEDLLYLRVTHGVGLGVVMKGHLVTGADGFAGEIGHVRAQPGANMDGPVCVRCNSVGCLEVVASEKAVIETLQRQAWQEEKRGPNAVSDFVNSTDPRTREAVGRAAWTLAFVLAAAANVLNPRWILLGGEMTEMAFFRDTFVTTMQKYALPQAFDRLRATTWQSMFEDPGFPLTRDRDLGARMTPELLGAMAFVIDELGDAFLQPRVARIKLRS